MEEKKKDSDVGLVFLIMLMVGLVLAVMGLVFCVIKLKEEKAKNNDLTAKQNNDTKIVYAVPEEEEDEPEELEEEEIIEDNKKFSDEEVKSSIQAYMNIAGSYLGSAEDLIKKLEVEYLKEELENNIIKTNIDYDDFTNKMLNYMTKELYEKYFYNSTNEYSDSNRLYNIDGFLGYSKYMQSGAECMVESISFNVEKEVYVAHTYDPRYEEKRYEDVEFKIENVEGKCVISECKKYFE